MTIHAALALVVAAGLAAAAGPGRASVDVDEIDVQAIVVQRLGTSAATAIDIRRQSQRNVGLTSEAEATITAPGYSQPTPLPGDTFFIDATARAYQTALGFNATAVDGAFANGQGYNRLSATTEWQLSGFVRPRIGVVETARLEYLLFPGLVGISRFGSALEAGFRYEISLFADGTERFHLDASVVLKRPANSQLSTLGATGPFAAVLSRGSAVRHGITHDTAMTEAFLGDADLGSFTDLTEIALTYTMESWLVMPGHELSAFSQVGDPFALSSDATAEVARHFPGLGTSGFSLSSTTAPVPEPGAAGLLAAGLAGLAWRVRRQGCARRPG